MLPTLDDDERIMPVLYSFAHQKVSREYVAKKNQNEMTADEVKGASIHFPPCMMSMYQSLVKDGHLKHQARIQFGLFLKGAGLSLEEALVFWRKAFLMSDDEYNKKGYVYNIR